MISVISPRAQRALCVLCALGAFCFLIGCNQTPASISKSGFYFDTVITVTLYDEQQESVLEDCFALAEDYENLLSPSLPCSDIYKINHAKGTPVTVSDETLFIIQKGLEYAKVSEDNFDITVGCLSSLWNFSENLAIVPNETDIGAALATVDYHNIIIDGNNISLQNPDSQLDVGGLAKGYIADQMKEYLNDKGITSGIINLGGNVLVIGPKDNGEYYNIGIQKPFSPDGTAAAMVQITNQTVVSSGVYERYFYQGDQLFHHLLNPKTGYPFDQNLLGVTIICSSSVDGDGLSTTCFALGLEDGMKLIEARPDTEAIFITADYQIHKSSGIGETIPYQEFDN